MPDDANGNGKVTPDQIDETTAEAALDLRRKARQSAFVTELQGLCKRHGFDVVAVPVLVPLSTGGFGLDARINVVPFQKNHAG